MAWYSDPGASDDLALRITDEERARAAGLLDAAVADGRLTWTEHSERTGLVWAARTRGDLGPHLADLGEIPRPDSPTRHVLAVASKVSRALEPGQVVVARALFGAVILDFSLLQPGEQVEVEASSFCGKVIIYVPENATVIDHGTVVLGKRTVVGAPPGPGGPVVRLSGRSTLGHLRVHRGLDDPWHRHGHHGHHGHHHEGGARHVHIHHDRHLHLHGADHHRHGHRDRRARRWGNHPPHGYW